MTTVTREDFSCAAATNESAYRRVTVPVLRIDAGPGPAVALMAGVHGDEWEGQAAILELWHQLPGILNRGTVYLLPAANAEASLAGRRLSPNDGGNLNRAFLGPPARGYTESVAAALEAKLLPRVEALVDVHSGGASLRYLPSSVITRYGRDALDPRLPALARAFGWGAARVDDPAQLDAALAECLAHDGPYFLDVAVAAQENCFPMMPAGHGHQRMMLAEGVWYQDETS